MRRLLPLLIVGLLAAVLLGGCPRRRPTRTVPARPPAPKPAAPVSPADAARDVVLAYLRDLQGGKFAAAYDSLSAESRRRHSLSDFSRKAAAGMTYFDPSSARVTLTNPARAEVSLQLEDDPAVAKIVALQEGGKWRVVYLGGRPSWPYP